MPVYDYACDGCQHSFEAEHGIKEPALKDCPECQQPKLYRRIGRVHIGLCETTYMRDAKMNASYLDGITDPKIRQFYLRKARQAGVSIQGKNYNPAIARFQGDPDAWVGGIDDIQRVAKKNGWHSEIKDGTVQVTKGDLVTEVQKRKKQREAKVKKHANRQ